MVLYARLIASAMLLGCLIDGLPYGYFQLLRWVVCGVCGYRAYLAYTLGKKIWLWAFVVVAAIFNPIAPIQLDREVWQIIDPVLAVVLLISLVAVKARKEA
jgi:hypothetical protein